jgi:phosphoglycerate dehydrogenase-like enzyme
MAASGRIVRGVVTLPHGRVFVGPEPRPDIEAAIIAAGGTLAVLPDAEAIVWTGDDPEYLRASLHARIRWVQLCAAGVDTWMDPGVIDRQRVWTAAKGVAARPIAEHIVCLLLAAARELPRRLAERSWGSPSGRSLSGSTVGIVGCGGIGTALVELLQPFGASSIALTRTGRAVPGAACSLGAGALDVLLAESDWVVVAAPATPKTARLIDRRALGLMRSHSWIVNVSRGSIIDTEALVHALRDGRIAGAALDVTDPEPLPRGHSLWTLPNVIVTPHTATTPAMHASSLCRRIQGNLSRFRSGKNLIGVVDVDEGY